MRYGFYSMLLLLFLGCGFRVPARPTEITISKGQIFRPLRPEDVKSEGQAIQAIITACDDSLRLPKVDPLHLKLYKNSASMAFYGRGWSTLAIDVENEIAFTQANTIHVNLEAVPKRPFALVKVLAHEYAHAIHYSLTGNNLLTPNWFNEGFADWFAAKILNSLNWQNYDTVLESTREECGSKVNLTGVNGNVNMSGWGNDNPDDERREAVKGYTKSVSRGSDGGASGAGVGRSGLHLYF